MWLLWYVQRLYALEQIDNKEVFTFTETVFHAFHCADNKWKESDKQSVATFCFRSLHCIVDTAYCWLSSGVCLSSGDICNPAMCYHPEDIRPGTERDLYLLW